MLCIQSLLVGPGRRGAKDVPIELALALDFCPRFRPKAPRSIVEPINGVGTRFPVRLLLDAGRITDAERLRADLHCLMPAQSPSPMGSFLETSASWCEIQTRIALARGRSKEAIGLLQELRAKLSAAGMRFLEARASMMLALTFERGATRRRRSRRWTLRCVTPTPSP